MLITNRGVLLVVAPTFAGLHSRAESGVHSSRHLCGMLLLGRTSRSFTHIPGDS